MNRFTIALFTTLVAAAFGAHPTFKELHDAVNTEQKIWIDRRTFNPKPDNIVHRCVHVKKLELEGDNYEFEQRYKAGTESKKKHLYATLKEGEGQDGYPSFIVREKKESNNGLPYTLVYWNGDDNCGILNVTIGGTDEYELHVRNDRIDKVPDSCVNQYKKLTDGRPEITVYSPGCRNEWKD